MVATALVAIIVFGAWTYLVVSYDSPLGTDNVVNVERTSTSNGTSDALATLSFQDGAEDLDWASTLIEIEVNDTSYTCSFGSQSVEAESNGKVNSRLSSDGVTFSTTIDATSEDAFSYFFVPMQREGNESSYTLRASKTDIYLSDGVQWAYTTESFQEITSFNKSELSNLTEDRLEWYTYDLSAHRITANEGTYIVQQNGTMYKMQFLSYYNENDESRHITVLTSALSAQDHPALQDPSLVIPSPCLIETSEDSNYWNATQSIVLREQDVNICDVECNITFLITYETKAVEIEYTS